MGHHWLLVINSTYRTLPHPQGLCKSLLMSINSGVAGKGLITNPKMLLSVLEPQSHFRNWGQKPNGITKDASIALSL
jgi:hypothetical protein